jgi:hypothetical protein
MGTRIKVLRQGVCCCRDVEVLRRDALISYAAGQDVSEGSSPDFAEIGSPVAEIPGPEWTCIPGRWLFFAFGK